MELIISVISLVLSIVSVALVYFQTRVADKTIKTQMVVSLIDQLYSDNIAQEVLVLIYSKDIEFSKESGEPVFISHQNSKNKVITSSVEMFLNRFQVIGHMFYLDVLSKKDLQGIRYEIIRTGRDKAIRQYFCYLNNEYQTISGVKHNHFAYFKDLYKAFEEEKSLIQSFDECPESA